MEPPPAAEGSAAQHDSVIHSLDTVAESADNPEKKESLAKALNQIRNEAAVEEDIDFNTTGTCKNVYIFDFFRCDW